MVQQNAESGMRCIKYMLFTTNFMFAMIGFLLISVGSTITAIYSDFEIFMESHYFSPAQLLIAIGVLIFFVSLFGCLGAFKQSTCLVNTYAFFLSIILLLEISAAIAAYSMRANVQLYVRDRMDIAMEEYYGSDYQRDSMDFLQRRLQCCGVDGISDWGQAVPSSCYMDEDQGTQISIYKSGCLNKLSFIVSECATLVGTGGVCVAIVQFLGVIFASMLAKSIRRLKTQADHERQENMKFYAQLASGNKEKPTPVLYTPTDIKA